MLRQKDGFTERAVFVIDADGMVCYSEVGALDQQPDNEVLRKILQGLRTPKPPPLPKPTQHARLAYEDDDAIPENGVVLYCTRWCKDCKTARAWLNAHGVSFVEVDVDYNMTARNRVKAWANGSVVTPTIDFEGTIVVDYHEDQYEAALKKLRPEV